MATTEGLRSQYQHLQAPMADNYRAADINVAVELKNSRTRGLVRSDDRRNVAQPIAGEGYNPLDAFQEHLSPKNIYNGCICAHPHHQKAEAASLEKVGHLVGVGCFGGPDDPRKVEVEIVIVNDYQGHGSESARLFPLETFERLCHSSPLMRSYCPPISQCTKYLRSQDIRQVHPMKSEVLTSNLALVPSPH